ncbi:tetratricopeptide repeat protein [Tumebacillus sp. ITR2]|uniref:Tetratricopeptide repeat protein n=1 Tax=Tumebacillus amylolyticus TaxID=2801339 RepID=A0ABS1JDA6_9BACL|nr:tetratricopeptide repeat protein [Tumebacillus amylolyticus]MBL0388255.1 tetratricopeptide repeat protein [Tumebacillus amylolyticus]
MSNEAMASAFVVYAKPRDSLWLPTPVLHRVVDAVLRACSPTVRAALPFDSYMMPLLPAWVRREVWCEEPLQLRGENTNQPDASYGDAVLMGLAELVLTALRAQEWRLVVEVPTPLFIGQGDRRFLHLLSTSKAGQEIGVEVRRVPVTDQSAVGRSKSRVPLTLRALRRNCAQRVLVAALRGIDHALLAGLYREAAVKLVFASRLFRDHETIRRVFVDRMSFAYTMLGQHERSLACRKWQVAHGDQQADVCSAYIDSAIQRLLAGVTEESMRESRREFAQALALRPVVEAAQDRTLIASMWCNSFALWLYRAGNLQAASRACARAYQALEEQELLQTHLGQLGIICTNAVRVALARGQQEHASLWADRLAAVATDHPQVLEQCGKLYARLGHYEAAAAWTERAVHAGPPMPRLLKNLALYRYHTGEYAAALSAIEWVLSWQEGETQAFMLHGAILEALEDVVQAEKAYRQALEKSPEQATVWADLGRVLWEQNRFDEALQALEQGVRCAPERADLQELLTMLTQERNALDSHGGESPDPLNPSSL